MHAYFFLHVTHKPVVGARSHPVTRTIMKDKRVSAMGECFVIFHRMFSLVLCDYISSFSTAFYENAASSFDAQLDVVIQT